MSRFPLFDGLHFPDMINSVATTPVGSVGFAPVVSWLRRGRLPAAIFGGLVAAATCYSVYKVHCFGELMEANSDTIAMLQRYDAHWRDLLEVVEQARQDDGLSLDGSDTNRPLGPRLRRRQGRKEKMTFALAGSAYLQFGFNDKSLANLLIYRKYMRDELTQYKDLRNHNAAEIIDAALHLSFLPSPALRRMNRLMLTPAFRERMSQIPGSRWQRWNFWSSGLGVPIARA